MAISDGYIELISSSVQVLKDGSLIIYPTESVFGLGCDPFNKTAVASLLQLKKRSQSQGLILIASNWLQVENLIKPISKEQYAKVIASWPGNVTWVFSKSSIVPDWISGIYDTIAIRVPDHEIARKICEQFDGPIVSTSANISGEGPCKSLDEVYKKFSLEDIGYVLPFEIGNYQYPSTIIDLQSGKVLR
ncbi:MAG: threonylcarbamoyl-AMP synthase [Legionellales bacterium]|nr:threonylcarbamoyl-AMP synthase [Legionellales bacterium]